MPQWIQDFHHLFLQIDHISSPQVVLVLQLMSSLSLTCTFLTCLSSLYIYAFIQIVLPRISSHNSYLLPPWGYLVCVYSLSLLTISMNKRLCEKCYVTAVIK